MGARTRKCVALLLLLSIVSAAAAAAAEPSRLDVLWQELEANQNSLTPGNAQTPGLTAQSYTSVAFWVMTSPLHPVWQLDFRDRLLLESESEVPGRWPGSRYIASVYRITLDYGWRLMTSPVRAVLPQKRVPAVDIPIGLRLDNGWSVGIGADSVPAEMLALPPISARYSTPDDLSPMLRAQLRF